MSPSSHNNSIYVYLKGILLTFYQSGMNTTSSTDFKTSFNPLVPIGRLFLFATLALPFFLFYEIYHNRAFQNIDHVAGIVFISLICLLIVFIFFKEFLKQTKNYVFRENEIEVFNFLTLGRRIIKKEEVKGFSVSFIPYRRLGKSKQIIIYMHDGSHIELMQFCYFNFKKIKTALQEKNYPFLGSETYVWKWFNSREYRFDR